MKILRTATIPLSLNILLKGQLRFLSKYFEVVAVSGAGSDLEAVRDREGVRTESVEMARQVSPLQDLRSLWRLYKLFKKEKPEIVHSITPKAGLLTMVAGKMAGVPVRIHTFTGLIFPYKTGIFQKILIAMDRLLCRCATHIFPEGQGVKNDLLKFKITDKPLKIIANGNVNGIDLTHFNPENFSENENSALKKILGILPEDFVFVFVGRLVKDKGINELVAAFKMLQETIFKEGELGIPVENPIKDFILEKNRPFIKKIPKLLLVGPLEQALDPLLPETLREIENNSAIISVGYQDDVRPFFAISDALAFPSYREGFPNVVLQAGAMGLPSIVTNINGCNEIIKDGENGLIIPAKDSDSLAEAMHRLIMDETLYKSLKICTRRVVSARFNQTDLWEALLWEYVGAAKSVGLSTSNLRITNQTNLDGFIKVE